VKQHRLLDYPLHDLDLSIHIESSTDSSVQNPYYNLFAVINHIGEIEAGRYLTESRRDGSWFRFDDYRVQAIDEPLGVDRTCYVLFYIKTDTWLEH
jgi:ubiquitin C-terminal hydrolase